MIKIPVSYSWTRENHIESETMEPIKPTDTLFICSENGHPFRLYRTTKDGLHERVNSDVEAPQNWKDTVIHCIVPKVAIRLGISEGETKDALQQAASRTEHFELQCLSSYGPEMFHIYPKKEAPECLHKARFIMVEYRGWNDIHEILDDTLLQEFEEFLRSDDIAIVCDSREELATMASHYFEVVSSPLNLASIEEIESLYSVDMSSPTSNLSIGFIVTNKQDKEKNMSVKTKELHLNNCRFIFTTPFQQDELMIYPLLDLGEDQNGYRVITVGFRQSLIDEQFYEEIDAVGIKNHPISTLWNGERTEHVLFEEITGFVNFDSFCREFWWILCQYADVNIRTRKKIINSD